MKTKKVLEYSSYDTIASMPERERMLVERARQATATAHADHSGFRVGAAALLRSGRVLTGSNQESEVYPATLCAERTLLYYHQANHADDPIVALAIASDPDERECYPCGQCRQTIADVERRQGSPIKVIMSGGGSASVVESGSDLLPFLFRL
ncbi:MAG: cytidine deaminase [Rikenellaceae bacterium]|nr:cytidine deaminase [Rikenellaceae bacterium]